MALAAGCKSSAMAQSVAVATEPAMMLVQAVLLGQRLGHWMSSLMWGQQMLEVVGTGGAASCGGWSKVGTWNAADEAEAMDGAIDTAGADWTGTDVGIWNTDDDPGAGALAILDDADDEAGPVVAGGARDRDAQVNDGSLRC